MDSNVAAPTSLSNGNVSGPVATHCMDVLDAVYHTARSYKGGARALASRLQTRDKFGDLVPMNENTFTHKVNPNCFSHNVTLEEGRDMMVMSQDFSILHALSADCGHVSIRMTFDPSGATFEKVSAMAKEFSEVVVAVSDAQSAASADGGRISPNEMSRIEREAVELMAALNGLVANLRAQASTGVR